jgi:acetyl esterase/lipase
MKKEAVTYNYSLELKPPPASPPVNFENKTVQYISGMMFKRATRLVKKYKAPVGFKKDVLPIPSPDGYKLLCYCIEKDNRKGKKPVILYFHGGGFISPLQTVIFDNAVYYANELDCKVFMPEYRVLPKYPYPVPLQDCYNTFVYIEEHEEELGIDTNKMIVYGDSAGGCLTASVTQIIRDKKRVKPVGQMLIYPCVDDTCSFPSMKEIKFAAWPANSTPSLWRLYFKNGYGDMKKYAVPLKFTNFYELPSAYVEPHEIDCLRDEGIAYAKKLEEAGIPTELNIIKGSYHGADADHTSPLIKRVLKHRCEVMRSMFTK